MRFPNGTQWYQSIISVLDSGWVTIRSIRGPFGEVLWALARPIACTRTWQWWLKILPEISLFTKYNFEIATIEIYVLNKVSVYAYFYVYWRCIIRFGICTEATVLYSRIERERSCTRTTPSKVIYWTNFCALIRKRLLCTSEWENPKGPSLFSFVEVRVLCDGKRNTFLNIKRAIINCLTFWSNFLSFLEMDYQSSHDSRRSWSPQASQHNN